MGADYKSSSRCVLQFGSHATIAGGATQYFTFGGQGLPQWAEVPIPIPGLIRNLYAHSGGPPGAGETYTYTVMINGIAVAITCQTGGAVDDESTDLVNAIAVVPGDDICIRCVASGAAAAEVHTAGIELVG